MTIVEFLRKLRCFFFDHRWEQAHGFGVVASMILIGKTYEVCSECGARRARQLSEEELHQLLEAHSHACLLS